MAGTNPIAWITAEKKGGIRNYSETLLPELGRDVVAHWDLESIFEPTAETPRLIHIQHEFGLFGSKTPGRYRFPAFLRRLRSRFPDVPVVATAHTVLPETFRYELKGKGMQVPARMLANALLMPSLVSLWTRKTWGALDGTIVHSALQLETLRFSGCPQSAVIPHFVPMVDASERCDPTCPPTGRVVVFGYFSIDKGQDVVIHAWAILRKRLGDRAPKLVLAGGVRREEDRPYFERCERMIRELDLSAWVEITGYIPSEQVSGIYQKSELVIVPFRMTSGSGSIAQALARGANILASNLPLNLEIAERMPGAIEYFRSEDPTDLAMKAQAMLEAPIVTKIERASAALRYAEAHSPRKVADLHRGFYRLLLGSEHGR